MSRLDEPMRFLGVGVGTALWNLIGFCLFVGLMLGIAVCGIIFSWGAP